MIFCASGTSTGTLVGWVVLVLLAVGAAAAWRNKVKRHLNNFISSYKYNIVWKTSNRWTEKQQRRVRQWFNVSKRLVEKMYNQYLNCWTARAAVKTLVRSLNAAWEVSWGGSSLNRHEGANCHKLTLSDMIPHDESTSETFLGKFTSAFWTPDIILKEAVLFSFSVTLSTFVLFTTLAVIPWMIHDLCPSVRRNLQMKHFDWTTFIKVLENPSQVFLTVSVWRNDEMSHNTFSSVSCDIP